ncbi:MAG TPA: GTP cyclohydrolase I, partial [bacterium]
MDLDKTKKLVKELLVEIGEDPAREGLVKTPERVAEAWQYLTSGYGLSAKEV